MKRADFGRNFESAYFETSPGTPHIDLTLSPPTSFIAMERYIGNMLISIIPCHMKILKNKKDILWKEF